MAVEREIRQKFHFVSTFALRVLASPKSLTCPIFALLMGQVSRTHFVSSHLALVAKKKERTPKWCPFLFIGIARFELTTSCSRSKRSTRLSYIPVRWSNNRKKLEEFKGERRKKMKKVEFLFLGRLSGGFCWSGARFSEDHDA